MRRRRAAGVLRHAVLVAWVLVVLFPVFWMVLTSFKDAGDWVSWPARWAPFVDFEPTLLNYRQIFYIGGTTQSGELRREAAEQAYVIWKGVADSVVIVTIASVASLLLGSALAYAISRFRTGGRNYPYTILTIRMLPPIVVAIPMLIYYTTIPELFESLLGVRVEFFDTYYGLVLLYIVTTLPYVIWMMLAFIDEVPRELEDAARLMGAGRLATLRKVVFPLVASGMMVTLLFVFILNWSEFLLALTLSQPKVLTLPVLLNKFQSAVEGRLYGPQAAIGTVVTIPVVIFGFLIQKHLVKGFSFGMIRR
ncbi:MAG TPA: carbohydrate ABC transporter permease [Methylomirabilota bacterium]|nr:carbohydrate ABC transporter permease [Methylomirabilota bacterium]